MHHAVEASSLLRESFQSVALSRRCRPPAPRGWWSLTRSSPTSRVQCHSRRHRLFGSDAVRQLPAPHVPTFVEVFGESDLREPSPHSVMRFRHHSSMDRTRSVVSCEARLRVPRVRNVVGVIPLCAAPRAPVRYVPSPLEVPRGTSMIRPVFGRARDASTSRESFRG